MPLALEVRALSKRYVAGSGGCTATATILSRVNLAVHAGEVVTIVGDRASGKSTLLLCLAGLMTPDSGELRWFGERRCADVLRRVIHHVRHTDLLRAGCLDQPNLHLVDAGLGFDADGLSHWTHARSFAGDAVIIAAREAIDDLPRGRVITLRRGVLHELPMVAPRSRVAEVVHH
jgi:energy-coupling factor transporter ATP-binding protein EcfA2